MSDEHTQGAAEPTPASDGSVMPEQLDAIIEGLERIKELEAEIARLRSAATALYRHRWACDDLQPGEQAALWESMRDAIGLPSGTATRMGVHGHGGSQ